MSRNVRAAWWLCLVAVVAVLCAMGVFVTVEPHSPLVGVLFALVVVLMLLSSWLGDR